MDSSGTVGSDCGPPQRKSVLFCANCGHDNHVEGDWILHERSGSHSVWYQCPECGRAVSVRPSRSLEQTRFPSPISVRPSRGAYGTPPEGVSETEFWDDFWETYRQVATAWLTPWGSSFASAD